MVTKHPTITINQPVNSSLNKDSMWESNYTLYISLKTIEARWRLRYQREDDLGLMVLPTLTYSQKKRAFHGTGQTRACCPGLRSACWGPYSPHLTLLLFAAVDGKFYEARLSFTTNPNELRPERRGKRKRKKEGSITRMTLTGCRSDKLTKPHPQVNRQSLGDTRHGKTRCKLPQICLYLVLLPGSLSEFGLKPMDHRSQPKCNWTRKAASRLSLSLITNYNRGQLKLPKLYSKQCWFYYPQQKYLLIHANARWKADWVSSFPRMMTETNNECSSQWKV